MDRDLKAADLSLRKNSGSDDQEILEDTIDLSMRHRTGSNLNEAHHFQVQHDNPSTGNESFNGVPSRSRSGRPTRFVPESLSSNSPDVVILSDEEPKINGHINGYSTDSRGESPDFDRPSGVKLREELSVEAMQEREETIHRLREVLRNEEMKLVLLKKLRQSQNLKESVLTSSSGGVPSGKLQSSINRVSAASSSGNMPPYVRVGTGIMGKSSQQTQPQSSALNHLAPSHSTLSRALGSNSNAMVQQSVMRSGIGGLPRTPVTTPPNVVMGYPIQGSKIAATTSYLSSMQNQVTITQVPSTLSPMSQNQGQQERLDVQTPAQKQAAAKLALRKQLEKTLLQIPPPKPPPPEMHFIPNANNQEFVYLVGLEVVVGLLIGDEQTAKPPPDPFECVQCRTDFTPVWKWQDANAQRKKPSVICESCVTSNIKKALKAEHTNRLKTAFVKALQQEQEIEQRMSQASSPPPTPSTPPVQLMNQHMASSTPPTSHSPIHMGRSGSSSSAAANAVAAAVANSAALLQNMPKLSAAHHPFLQAQHLQQFAQGLPHNQPQPAHMLPFGPLLAAQAYSYQMLGKSSVSSSELQRQYLLDMIPPRSIPQSTTMNWKT